MYFSRAARLAIFTCVLVFAGGAICLHARQFQLQLGGPPSSIGGEFKTEEDWIVNEIVRDIAEMSARARRIDGRKANARAIVIKPGIYRVSAPGLLRADHELNLTARVWDSIRFAEFAAVVLADTRPSESGTSLLLHSRLAALSPQAVADASRELSHLIANRVSDPTVHGSAALTLAAFALRESSGRFHDVRWSLNRMTAHLAMARALDPRVSQTDAELAHAALLTLANHQKDALAAIERIESGGTTALPWTRALRMRLTQDYTLLTERAKATLLEKLEYLRARRVTAGHMRAVGDFDELHVNPTESVDWTRILQAHQPGVEEGRFIADGLGLQLEQQEAQRFSGGNLHARAGRTFSGAKPAIVPAGAWAESSQRHVAMLVGSVDRFWRHLFGDDERAMSAAADLDAAFGKFTMYAPGTTFRTKGQANGDADLERINDAISVAIDSPERINAFVWQWLERGSRYEPLRAGMPVAVKWFTRPSPRMPYDAANRFAHHTLSPDEILALAREAPLDYALTVASLQARFGSKPPYRELQSALGRRLQYDFRAVDYAVARIGDDEGLELREWACSMSPTHCLSLAAALAWLGHDEEAASNYERAFAHPDFDTVGLANASRWLVRYYQRTGRPDKAFALADASAAIGSQTGLITAAQLYESSGRFDVAQQIYQAVHERYHDPTELLGFYYRAVMIRKDRGYDNAWHALAQSVFPEGLQDAPLKLDAAPNSGVIIVDDNWYTIKRGLQAGDIVIGLEDLRVENLKQFNAINAFFTKDEMKVTLWRASAYTVTIKAQNRRLGLELRTYPIEHWKERSSALK